MPTSNGPWTLIAVFRRTCTVVIVLWSISAQATHGQPAAAVSSHILRSPRLEVGGERFLVLDDPIRQLVEKSLDPAYPEASIARGESGVVVAQVRLSSSGEVRSVEVLQAPSQEMAESVRQAVAQWKFRKDLEKATGVQLQERELTGKLTFYFWSANGRYRVGGPKSAPNLSVVK